MSVSCSEVAYLIHACVIKTTLDGTLMDCINALLYDDIIELHGVFDEMV